MNNELKIFENEQFGSIRTVELDGTPYFVGKDVAEALGYSNTKDAILTHVDDEDKKIVQRSDFATIENYIPKSAFPVNFVLADIPNRGLTVITESGVYALIFGSKLPKAKEFKHWVTAEVLPAIRKHGLYATDELIADPDLAIAAFTALKEERAKTKQLTETVAVQNQQIAELKPKASYYDVVLNCSDLMSISQIAKDYGKSAKWLNNLLHELGIQFKQGNIWLLYQKYAQNGYTSTKTQTFNGSDGKVHSKVHTYWTQKGRLFIYDLMKKHDYYPLIEAKTSL